MKRRNEVEWISVLGITYTDQEYSGASVFKFFSQHVPSGKIFKRKIYGVTEEQGTKLVEFWDKVMPKVWRYSVTSQLKQLKLNLEVPEASINFTV